MRRHVRCGPTGRAGRKFAFLCLTGHDCRRDIARYMPTRSGRRGARKMQLKVAARARARPSERCIAAGAMHCTSCRREKEREGGSKKVEERKREDTQHLIFSFSLPRYTTFVYATRLPFFERHGFRVFVRRTSINQLT